MLSATTTIDFITLNGVTIPRSLVITNEQGEVVTIEHVQDGMYEFTSFLQDDRAPVTCDVPFTFKDAWAQIPMYILGVNDYD